MSNYTLHRFKSNPSAATISAHYSPYAMGVLLFDIHSSEPEKLDKPCATVGR